MTKVWLQIGWLQQIKVTTDWLQLQNGYILATILLTNSWLQSYILITEWEQIQMGYLTNPTLTAHPNPLIT